MTDFQADAVNYGAFVAGQLLFMLKRAGSAVRNPVSVYSSKWQFFKQNLDTLLIRTVIEFPFFYGWRHYSVAQILAVWGVAMPTGWAIPNNPLASFFLGYAADSLLDWVSMSTKLPAWFRQWLSENVPHLPAVELKLVPKAEPEALKS